MEHLGQFIINHWGLWVLLLVVLGAIFLNEFLAQKKAAKALSPEAVVELLNEDKAVIIDLRDKETYSKGHIIHAIQASEDDFLSQRMDKYKTKTIVFVCARGQQSAALATKLRSQGFSEPLVLAGGIQAWQSRDLPLVKGK
jgi:rhodanese-related sulfurtransferase